MRRIGGRVVSVVFDVVSIGCLSRNHFWNERQPVRAPHATTTLVRDGTQTILVDPSLPAELLSHRLDERAGLKPGQINCVFLTSFQPVHRRALRLFDRADWLMHETEIAAFREHLERLSAAGQACDAEQTELVRHELALLERIKPAPEKLTPSVHLFPSPGVTPGSCSLLLVPATATIAIVGDAVVSREYLEHGRVFERCTDAELAAESLMELIEIADQIICGHDNVVMCQGRRL
jgi:glyoxylase-like metal-dependent hydrolase (beta-lactamase superfamily II)